MSLCVNINAFQKWFGWLGKQTKYVTGTLCMNVRWTFIKWRFAMAYSTAELFIELLLNRKRLWWVASSNVLLVEPENCYEWVSFIVYLLCDIHVFHFITISDNKITVLKNRKI